MTCNEFFTNEPFKQDFDYLMIACGMRSRTFKTPGLCEANNAFFLKNLWDARKIRACLIKNLERAANPNIPTAERRRLLTCLIVGGGPTSVEFAGELHGFVKSDIKRWFPDLY